jgi:signal transduction histidine kinase
VQVFGNLVGNAVKYTPTRGRVDVGATRCDGGVRVVVKDSGIGIPADDLPHVAERFFRARNATKAEIPGSGIGLFVSRSIVERLGGTVTFASVENEGTTIEVFLPFAAPEGSGEFRRLQEVGHRDTRSPRIATP